MPKDSALALNVDELSPRQQEVLDAALRLLVKEGARLTMSSVAAEANCSKETLYKWFGGRDGLLVAIVRWQAAQVRVPAPNGATVDRGGLESALRQFAEDWLGVVSSERSLALNRLAIGHAGDEGADLGRIVLDNGRLALGQRMKPVLEAARAANLVLFEDAEEAFRTLFGLVARDVHIRLLLGERLELSLAQIAREAERAAAQFLSLYASPGSKPQTVK